MIEYIVKNVKELSSLNACLKQPVYAMLITKNGNEYFGSNEMKACVNTCPREELKLPTGEGYEHCKDTCKQEFHAEDEAVSRAKFDNVDTNGSTMYLTGHYYCCDNCIQVMKNTNVKKVVFLDTRTEIIL